MRIIVLMSLASPWARVAASALQALGHDVHIVDFATASGAPAYISAVDATQQAEVRALKDIGIRIHLLKTRHRSIVRYLLAVPQLRRIADEVSGEIVLTLYGGGLAMLAWLSGIRPYAVYVVGSDVLFSRGWGRRLSRLFLERAEVVFANGRYLARQTELLAPRARVSQLYLGVLVDEFMLTAQQVPVPRVLCTRGFLPVYNNEYLIEGLAALPCGTAPVPVTFIANGPELERVRARADQILSPDQRTRITFVGGADSVGVRVALRSSQIYVSLSVSDGTSTSLLEALASGLFPVLSDIPQNREWLDPVRTNGILVPLNDPVALATAIERAVGDETLRVEAAVFNRRLVSERADARMTMAMLADRLAELVEGKLS